MPPSRLLRCSFALAALLLLPAACSDPAPEVASNQLTYWGDVAPLLNDKCVTCHQPGGVGPFSMVRYEDVRPRAASIAAMTRARMMPPYLVTHDGTCGDFEDSAALDQAQIDLIQRWATGTMAEGTRVTLAAPTVRQLEGATDYKTPNVLPVAQGDALSQFDDYRCFMMDTTLTQDRFITGYDVLPGRSEIVHHVIAIVVDPARTTRSGKTNAETIQALDASDPDRVGWPCFGGAGEGVEDEGSPVVWAPGQGAVAFPDGMGMKQRPSDRLVIQVHYNLAAPQTRGLMDSTTVRLRYAESVEQEVVFLLPDGFLESVFTKPQPDTLPPGKASVSYTWTQSINAMAPEMIPPLELVGVMPHMHERGRQSELRFIGPGSRNDCLARVENWNFHWQKFYFYEGTRPRLAGDTKIQLTCTYDTSRDVEPTLPGWGTRNEMCLTAMIVALPRKP
jgi:hypothetical protein